MTLKEVKKLISESPNHELFSNHLINFNFHRSEIQRNFDGILSFYEYLLNQQNGYDKVDFELPQEFQDSKSLFKKLIDKVSTFIETYQNINQSSFLSVWEQHVNSVISGHRNLSIFEIDAPNTNFLLEIYKNKQSNYLGALHYLTLAINSSSLSDRNYLNGVILAYEYFQKGETEIEKRRIKEKSSLSKFRNHIYEYISQAEKNFIEYSASLKNKSENTIKEVESYKNSKTEEYEKWYQDTSSAFSFVIGK